MKQTGLLASLFGKCKRTYALPVCENNSLQNYACAFAVDLIDGEGDRSVLPGRKNNPFGNVTVETQPKDLCMTRIIFHDTDRIATLEYWIPPSPDISLSRWELNTYTMNPLEAAISNEKRNPPYSLNHYTVHVSDGDAFVHGEILRTFRELAATPPGKMITPKNVISTAMELHV